MLDNVRSIALSLIASAITGFIVWFIQNLVWRRRLHRQRRFFGLVAGKDCLLIVNRHASSKSDLSVHRTDVAALLRLAGVLEASGAKPQVLFHDERQPAESGTEFCLGGPDSNARTVAHLERLPGLTVGRYAHDPQGLTIAAGGVAYSREPGRIVYAVLAKIPRGARARPVFLISGQTSIANQGAVSYLVDQHRELMREHGLDGRFCKIVRVLESTVDIQMAKDVTGDAFGS